MTTQEVLALIGQPSRKVTYRNEPGPTWSYSVNGIADFLPAVIFEVNFDTNETVISTDERKIERPKLSPRLGHFGI